MEITARDPFGNITYSINIIEVINSTRHKSKNGETHKEQPLPPNVEADLKKALDNWADRLTGYTVKASENNIAQGWLDVTKLRKEDFRDPPKPEDDNGDFWAGVKPKPDLSKCLDEEYLRESKGMSDAMDGLFNKAQEKRGKETREALRDIYMNQAYKESEGKLFYELDWDFITQMAERMAQNKKEDKYNLFNWKNPMTPKGIEDLKQATLRHLLAVLKGKYEDDGRDFGHIESIACNAMMLNYQLKNNNK